MLDGFFYGGWERVDAVGDSRMAKGSENNRFVKVLKICFESAFLSSGLFNAKQHTPGRLLTIYGTRPFLLFF